MSILVVGQGAVGRALTVGLRARGFEVENSPARTHADCTHYSIRTRVVIYAGGPAGEAACRRDPVGAVKSHYSGVLNWVKWAANVLPPASDKRLVIIGTVLPETGFYGSLKALALDRAREQTLNNSMAGAVLALRCGQIIGPEMPVDGTGVVATWIRQVVRGEDLQVNPEGAPLTMTLCADLIERIATWLRSPITTLWEEERVCVSDPIGLTSLAFLCTATGLSVINGSPLRVPGVHGDVVVALHGMAENAARAMQETA